MVNEGGQRHTKTNKDRQRHTKEHKGMQRRAYTYEEWEEFYRRERDYEERTSGILRLTCEKCKGEGYDECYCYDED